MAQDMDILGVAQSGWPGDGAAFHDQRSRPELRNNFRRPSPVSLQTLQELWPVQDFLKFLKYRGRHTKRGRAIKNGIH